MTIYSLDVLLFLFGTSLLFYVQFELLLPDLHTDFSGWPLVQLIARTFPEEVHWLCLVGSGHEVPGWRALGTIVLANWHAESGPKESGGVAHSPWQVKPDPGINARLL